MSSKPEDAHHFSRSPSLLDILTYVDYRDILSIRKINQHLSDATTKYQVRLPRRKKTICFAFSKQINALHVEIYFTKSLRVCITNERIRQIKPKHQELGNLAESANQPCVMMGEGVESLQLEDEYIPIGRLRSRFKLALENLFLPWHFRSITVASLQKY